MAIGTNYPSPVIVNGFSCKNCTDVDYAKKHIDPAHPKSGPYGIDAKNDPTVKNAISSNAVTFGGALSSLNTNKDAPDAVNKSVGTAAFNAGAQLDLST